jgi:trehalose 6-phosphate synthase/phosphatase
MQNRIKQYDVKAWAEDFLAQLKRIKKKQLEFQIKFLDEITRIVMFDQYRKAENRLLLLDYDGTLVSYSSVPSIAKPGSPLLDLLENISSVPQNEVYIISGRDSQTLESWFGRLPVNIIAEHGAAMKLRDVGWHDHLNDRQEWKSDVKRIMNNYVKRCVNTLVEEKKFSMVWHYRNANPEQSKLRAMELVKELNQFTHNLGLQVVMGNKIVEVRNKGVDKGRTVKNILAAKNYDFILAAGDDVTDEDLFRVLVDQENAFTFKIGGDASFAKYNLHTPQMVISTLHAMSHIHETVK